MDPDSTYRQSVLGQNLEDFAVNEIHVTSPMELVAAQTCPRAIPPSLGGIRCGQ
ncbi:MAG: hypothetical protein M3Q86_07405 [Verrucomicrobiota bacterium]|nr:hypothetical protein [Verrucomicrobiota bacterium]